MTIDVVLFIDVLKIHFKMVNRTSRADEQERVRRDWIITRSHHSSVQLSSVASIWTRLDNARRGDDRPPRTAFPDRASVPRVTNKERATADSVAPEKALGAHPRRRWSSAPRRCRFNLRCVYTLCPLA